MSKTYSHAGVSKLNGEFKVRFCNDALRVKVLAKNGHKDIDIVELKNPMSKEDIVAYLLKINFDNGNKAVRAALEAAADKRGVTAPAKAPVKKSAPKAKKEVVSKTVTGQATVKPSKTVEQAQSEIVANIEDAPF